MKISRAEFLRKLLIAGVATQIPFVFSCSEKELQESEILSNRQLKIIRSVQEILFPPDEKSPSAAEVKADRYLLWVLSDKNIDPTENQYIINGIDWTDEAAQEQFSEPYNSLSQKEKEELVEFLANKDWGESWLSRILTLIFEALFADPLYGGNTNEIGWKWLNHNPGLPRPTKEQIYKNA